MSKSTGKSEKELGLIAREKFKGDAAGTGQTSGEKTQRPTSDEYGGKSVKK